MTTNSPDTVERTPLLRRHLRAVPSAPAPVAADLPIQQIQVRDRDGNAMRLAPSFFAKIRNATGVVAIILDHIEQKRLYKSVGALSQREFVVEKLGLAPSQYRLFRRAGRVARTCYPNAYEEVLVVVDMANSHVDYSFVPSARSLVLLSKLVPKLPQNERLHWHGQVESGAVGEQQLEEKLKQLRSKRPAPSSEELRARVTRLVTRRRPDLVRETVCAAVDAFVAHVEGLPSWECAPSRRE
jgi:hypothetical protein